MLVRMLAIICVAVTSKKLYHFEKFSMFIVQRKMNVYESLNLGAVLLLPKQKTFFHVLTPIYPKTWNWIRRQWLAF